ncbi:LysR family transcriptional regulator [Nocardiopsis sp. NPDC058789]|uniref:LysR family transcriptional regulator n=1 Tax=Nocardiopsis TaxID=2013 RepID=UPI00366B0EE0
MLDLSRLRALHAVHVHGSVSAAAKALGYTPSAISQQVTKLERETGTALLERQGRGVVLTDAAGMLVDTASRMLTLMETAEVTLEERRGQPSGRLTVAAFATAARGLLPRPLAELTLRYPDLDLRVVEEDPHSSPHMVAQGTVDLAVVHDWDIAPMAVPEGVSRAALGADRCDVVLPRDHPLAELPVLNHQDVASQRWICQPPGTVCHDWLTRTLRPVHGAPDIAHFVAEFQTQLALVEVGLGIALVPRLGRGAVPDSLVVKPLEPVPVRGVAVLWREGTSRRPAVTEAVRLLREHTVLD